MVVASRPAQLVAAMLPEKALCVGERSGQGEGNGRGPEPGGSLLPSGLGAQGRLSVDSTFRT